MFSGLKEQFATEGYVVLKNVFSYEEVVSFKEEIRRILHEVKSDGDPKGGNDFLNGVYVGLAARSPIFQKLASDDRLVKALREVMGDNILFLSDKVVAKSAETQFASPWHQDWPYWNGSNKISVWIALDDAEPDNGCLKVIPKSHRTNVKHEVVDSEAIGFANRLQSTDVDESKAVSVSATAGTAIIFHDLLFHSSHPNTSGKDRWALISTYKDAMVVDPPYSWANQAILVSGKQL